MAPALPTQDYYVTLGVRPSALYGEIKAAYRRLALLHHPDKNNGSQHATATTQLINAAWEVLKDTSTRSEYDRSRLQRTASYSGNQPHAPPPAAPQPNPPWHRQREAEAQTEARAQAESNRIRQEWLNYERSQKEQIRQCCNTVKSLETELEVLNEKVNDNRIKLASDRLSKLGISAFLSDGLSEQEKSEIRLATINAENAIRIKQTHLDEARVRLEQLNDDLTKRKNQEGERLVAELAEKARKERLAKEEAEQRAKREQGNSRRQHKKEMREAELRAKQEAEHRARQEADYWARQGAEHRARQEADYWARQGAEYWARQAAEHHARQAAEHYARQAAEHYARQAAEQRARQEAEQHARREAEQRARQEAEQRARQEAGRARQEESRRRTTGCDHNTLWVRVEGQHTCALCTRTLDAFAMQCFGCSTNACVSCGQILRSGGNTCVPR